MVRINKGDIDMILATPGCPSGEGGRPYRGAEKQIFEEWRRHRLDSDEFTTHDLETFLATIKKR
jgi:hypothetical protein